jgi:hypothetical protein
MHLVSMMYINLYVTMGWCPTCLANMSNMLGVLYEAGIAYTSRTHEFIPVVGTVRFAHYIILVFCVGFFLFCLSSSCILCTQCCKCLWTIHSWLPLRLSLTFTQNKLKVLMMDTNFSQSGRKPHYFMLHYGQI